MFPINFNFPYRKKDGSIITMEKALDGAGADLDLIDLDDVAITTPTGGNMLVYNGTSKKWENADIDLDDVDDVDITTPTDGDVLVYNGTTEKWENSNKLTDNDTVKTGYIDVPESYYSGTSARINFEKRNGVVRAYWGGSSPNFPNPGTRYEIGDIPSGFVPANDVLVFFTDMTSFSKGMYLTLTSLGKIAILGYNTPQNSSINTSPSAVYIAGQ